MNKQGLSTQQAQAILATEGPNIPYQNQKHPILALLVRQYANALTGLLIGACILAALLQSILEASVIGAIVLINGLLGFWQEYRAHHTVEKLKKFLPHQTLVVRDGIAQQIESTLLVPGDLIILAAGDNIPADIRFVNTKNVLVNEAAVTGEAIPVPKNAESLADTHGYAGTLVVAGSGMALVVATGAKSSLGETVQSIAHQESSSYFHRSLAALSRLLVYTTLLVTAGLFLVHALMGNPPIESFLFALALAIGITPELLPTTLHITLAHGALQMAHVQVIIKKMSAMETFGNIDVLCADKTGTLTEGILSVQKIVGAEETLLYALLARDALMAAHNLTRNPIDQALWHYAQHHNLPLAEYRIRDTHHFDFTRLRTSVLVEKGDEHRIIIKGTSDALLPLCTLQEEERARLTAAIRAEEETGTRVIVIATRTTTHTHLTTSDETNLTFVGYITLWDPPKKTVLEALGFINNLSLELKIISGDSAAVTQHICNSVGVSIAHDRIILGSEFEALASEEQRTCMKTYSVFARVTPAQKERMVMALKETGRIVGFLGDGINDVPALAAADIGISVNTGVDIAKDTADVILLKKSLLVLGQGIMLGRKAFANSMKYILIVTSNNIGSVITIGSSSLILPFLPLLPAQILLNNFLTDIPLIFLATDTVEKSALKRPLHWDFGLIRRFMLVFGLIGAVFDFIIFAYFFLNSMHNQSLFRTWLFTGWLVSEIVVALSLRTTQPVWSSRPSIGLVVASLLAITGGIILIYLPLGAELFDFVPIVSATDWAVIIGSTALYAIVLEYAKRHTVALTNQSNRAH